MVKSPILSAVNLHAVAPQPTPTLALKNVTSARCHHLAHMVF